MMRQPTHWRQRYIKELQRTSIAKCVTRAPSRTRVASTGCADWPGALSWRQSVLSCLSRPSTPRPIVPTPPKINFLCEKMTKRASQHPISCLRQPARNTGCRMSFRCLLKVENIRQRCRDIAAFGEIGIGRPKESSQLYSCNRFTIFDGNGMVDATCKFRHPMTA